MKSIAGVAVLCLPTFALSALIGEWRFDNTTSPFVAMIGNNLMSSGHDPVFQAGGGYDGSGALRFSQGQYLVPSGGLMSLSATTGWTVSFWIKTTETGINSYYDGTPLVSVLGDTRGVVAFGIGVNGGKAAVTSWGYTSGRWASNQSDAVVADGQWHHVAVSESHIGIYGNDVQGSFSIYVDGKLSGEPRVMYQSNTNDYPGFSSNRIGVGYYAPTASFSLDDLHVYSSPLSSEAIGALVPEPAVFGLLLSGSSLLLVRKRQRTPRGK